MKKFISIVVMLLVPTGVFAGSGSHGVVISMNQDQSNELMLGAFMQMFWQHTFKNKFDSMTETMFDNIKGTLNLDGDGKEIPLDFKFVSDARTSSINMVYKF